MSMISLCLFVKNLTNYTSVVNHPCNTFLPQVNTNVHKQVHKEFHKLKKCMQGSYGYTHTGVVYLLNEIIFSCFWRLLLCVNSIELRDIHVASETFYVCVCKDFSKSEFYTSQ
jgi:hypothetical protein